MTNTDFYLSLEKSKQLKEWGCDLPSLKTHSHWDTPDTRKVECYLYHILEDICIRYAKEFFGEKYIWKTNMIISSMRENKKQEAEQYFLDHTIFNPKNKQP